VLIIFTTAIVLLFENFSTSREAARAAAWAEEQRLEQEQRSNWESRIAQEKARKEREQTLIDKAAREEREGALERERAALQQQAKEERARVIADAKARLEREAALKAEQTRQALLLKERGRKEAKDQRYHSQFTLKGHKGWVTSVSFSPDGQRVASGGIDGTIKIWNAKTGDLVCTFAGRNWVNGVAFNPDGTLVACARNDGAVELWDASTGKLVSQFDPSPEDKATRWESGLNAGVEDWSEFATSEVYRLAGERAFGRNPFNRHYPYSYLITGYSRPGLPPPQAPGAFARGERAGAGQSQRVALLTPLGKQAHRLFINTCRGVKSVAFSPDGTKCASLGSEIRVHAVATGRLVFRFNNRDWIHDPIPLKDCFAYSPNGRLIAESYRGIGIVDTTKEPTTAIERGMGLSKYEQTFKWQHRGLVYSIAFSPDAKQLASASYDKTIKVWDMDTGRDIRTVTGHKGWVKSVVFTSDGDRLVSGGADCTVRVWDSESGALLQTLEGHTDWVNSVAITRDEKYIASASGDGTVIIWQSFKE